MALERDGCDPGSEGFQLMTLFTKHLGDSRVVECTHQTAKDILRSSRHFQRAVTSRMDAVLHSPALNQRKVPTIPIPTHEKLTSGQWTSQKLGSFRPKTSPGSHKLHKDLQAMMLPNRGSHSWPSPTPASMFQGVASTGFLFTTFGQMPDGVDLDDAWQSILCGQPGSVIAHCTTGQLMWVVAYAEFSFLAWTLYVERDAQGDKPLIICFGEHLFLLYILFI